MVDIKQPINNLKRIIMKSPLLTLIKKNLLLVMAIQLLSVAAMAQVKYHAKDDLNMVVTGTSTLHDWSMKTSKGDCNATFTVNANGQPTGLTHLSFAIPADALKSDHSGMDKNAYKALRTDKTATITYAMTSATVASDGTVKCQGKLNIAGGTFETDLVAIAKLNADKSITVKGNKKISMKDYKIDPPTFMMGTIKTGNDVILKFDLTLRK
jgi:polyisoprenoid-binding protein YceI